jgi:Fe-S cluster assembly protein SufD
MTGWLKVNMTELSFLSHLQDHFDQQVGSSLLKSFREKAFLQLKTLGLPAKSHEAFRYVSLREFYQSTFVKTAPVAIEKQEILKAILPECKHSHLVFVDGTYSEQLSDVTALDPQIAILSLEEAMGTHGSFLQGYFQRSMKEEKDPFAFLNLSLHANGVFVYLPPKQIASAPLQCLHVITGKEPQLISPRLHLVLGVRSQLSCMTTTYWTDEEVAHCFLPTTEIALEEGARLDYFNAADGNIAYHLESLRASLKKDATFNSLNVTLGGKLARQSYHVYLKGENSEANLNGLWMLSKNHTAHTHATIEHMAPRTRSMQKFKGVLNDNSQSSFEGKIYVHPLAQKTEAYQLNNNLVLSQGAIANSKPNLEVFADDVKASHGATVSQLDEEQLFYLKTRGINPREARHLLVGGFCREMISGIPYDSLLKKMQSHIETFSGKGVK